MRPQFFVLAPSSERDEARAILDDSRPAWETIWCSHGHGMVKTRRTGPLVVSELPSQRDAVWTWFADLLVYDRVKRIIEVQLSGCTFAAVAFAAGCSPPREPLWELQVTGFAGFAATRGIEVIPRACGCGTYRFNFVGAFADLIDPRKWDGSDLFTIWPFPRLQLCAEKAAHILRCNDTSGIAVIPIDDFEVPANSAAPGLPSAWLDDDAVRRLMGDPDYMEAVWPA